MVFVMYPGFCYYSSMVRPTNQDMVVIEKIVCHSQFPTGRGTPHHGRPRREAPASVRRQTQQGERVAKDFFVILAGRNG